MFDWLLWLFVTACLVSVLLFVRFVFRQIFPRF